MSIAALALCVSLVACSGTGEPASGADPTSPSSATLAPDPSATTTAAYAFAVPGDARDAVTVVVDFDGDHSSAVFRGGLD